MFFLAVLLAHTTLRARGRDGDALFISVCELSFANALGVLHFRDARFHRALEPSCQGIGTLAQRDVNGIRGTESPVGAYLGVDIMGN
jgi:hypothetical protein